MLTANGLFLLLVPCPLYTICRNAENGAIIKEISKDNYMALFGNLFSRKEAPSDGQDRYSRFEKYTNKGLESLAKKSLSRDERKKFQEVMDGKIKVGRTMSADRILREVGSQHDYKFKQKIKSKLFTTKSQEGLDEERIKERNVALNAINRRRDESPVTAFSQHQDYQSAMPGSHQVSANQPNVHTPSDTAPSDNHTSVFNRAA